MRFRRGRATKQAFSTQVFVDIGPVDAVAPARNLPVLALGGRSIEQVRVPDERHGDHAAIAQGNAERVVVECDVQHSLICCRCRKTHSRPLRNCALCATTNDCISRSSWARNPKAYAEFEQIPSE